MVSGTVHVARTGQATGYHGEHPFAVSCDAEGLRSAEIGTSTLASGTNVSLVFVPCSGEDGHGSNDSTRPSSVGSECLELTFGQFEYGYVTMNEQVQRPPSTFAVNTTWFRTSRMRRV